MSVDELRVKQELEIGDFKIVVKELTVAEILDLIGGKELPEISDLMSFIAYMEDLLPLFLDGISIEEMRTLPPSQVKKIYESFREVNQVFFDLAQAAGLGKLMDSIKDAVVKDFLQIAADSLQQAMKTA